MNTKHRTYIGVFLVLTVACKGLDLGPKDQISDASFWKSPDQFRLAANDFYYYLQGAHNYTELNSDIAYGDAVSTQLRAVSNGSYLAEANSVVWDTNYFNIRATNYLLQKASESGLGAAIDRWVGEALFFRARSEEHTSELQSLAYLVCRLLLEKKNTHHHVARHQR